MDLPRTRTVVERGGEAGAFPAAVVEVGRASGPLWQWGYGRLTFDERSARTTVDTVFDLASLTKVIATASLAMRQVAAGRLDLAGPIGRYLRGASDAHRDVSVGHLLDHSSGLPAYAPLWEHAQGRHAYQDLIGSMALEHAPGTTAVYSDLGFILLGFLLEDVTTTPLDGQFAAWREEAGLDDLSFVPPVSLRHRMAPTEQDPWRGRLLVGEVHDENAAALGGVAAHAGLFGTAPAVGRFAALVLRTFRERTPLGSPQLMRRFAARTGVPGSSRALGWDTMLPTSSCGTRLSPAAIGHTGFTGTSLWIDPQQDLYVVLLTNRVHPTRQNDRFAALRPLLHDAVVADLTGSP